MFLDRRTRHSSRMSSGNPVKSRVEIPMSRPICLRTDSKLQVIVSPYMATRCCNDRPKAHAGRGQSPEHRVRFAALHESGYGTHSPSTAVQHSRQLSEVKMCPTPQKPGSLWAAGAASRTRASSLWAAGKPRRYHSCFSYRVVVRQSTARLASHKPPATAVKISAKLTSPSSFGNKSGIG